VAVVSCAPLGPLLCTVPTCPLYRLCSRLDHRDSTRALVPLHGASASLRRSRRSCGTGAPFAPPVHPLPGPPGLSTSQIQIKIGFSPLTPPGGDRRLRIPSNSPRVGVCVRRTPGPSVVFADTVARRRRPLNPKSRRLELSAAGSSVPPSPLIWRPRHTHAPSRDPLRVRAHHRPPRGRVDQICPSADPASGRAQPRPRL
jgi:hypothetical protein